ncbi:MAG: sigma-70 family RNA polymerase sigma factor [Candidatus Sungiibacteriota bacterium]
MSRHLQEEKSQSGILEMKDEDILRASQHEPAMFEMLVERYQEPLLRAAMRVVRNRDEAEDIVQEAFVKIYKNAGKFEKYEGIEFKSWAYKIAINTAITHYRKLKRGEFLTDDPAVFEAIDEESPEVRYSFAADAKSAVARALEKMPSHLQSVLRRYYLEDKSYRVIAEEENISIPTLKMRLFRAKKLFRKIDNEEQLN